MCRHIRPESSCSECIWPQSCWSDSRPESIWPDSWAGVTRCQAGEPHAFSSTGIPGGTGRMGQDLPRELSEILSKSFRNLSQIFPKTAFLRAGHAKRDSSLLQKSPLMYDVLLLFGPAKPAFTPSSSGVQKKRRNGSCSCAKDRSARLYLHVDVFAGTLLVSFHSSLAKTGIIQLLPKSSP